MKERLSPETRLVLVTVRDSVKKATAFVQGTVLPSGKTLVDKAIIDSLLDTAGFTQGEAYYS